ncbi:diguanylate cyclase [Sulfurimonas sp. C5]|uniref:GGDEF domain-containing response regulator n=1 Tax=Sulfurimonas sp. C5 TaxID=3036947 RepID=UPI0024581069|nr:diguanylate cyclase [Sulfurimonas sp. C5]MDH4943779.1 diguanylate cyclase [Sulfurimonas sp. C5]
MNTKPIILVVDDEQTSIDIVSKILSNKYDLRVAHNGEKALKAIHSIDIDLLLLDIQMPIMNGFEVAKKIRQEKKHSNFPIIFLSSDTNKESVVEGFEIGGNDYVTKPFHPQELLARVQTHLQIHQFQKFLEEILNKQSTIIVVSDGKELKFINKTGLDFFGFKDNDEFFKHYDCICDTFAKVEGCYYKKSEDDNWIEDLKKLVPQQRLVAIRSQFHLLRIFNVSIEKMPSASLYVIDFNDITESNLEQQQLTKKAMHDQLTGIYNRNYFDANVQSLGNLNRYDDDFKVVAFLDIDHFKKVNDTYGHDIGDVVLQQFVEIIQTVLRKTDTFIRWGGEEFIVIITVPDETLIGTILEKIRKSVEEYTFTTVGNITCSIGATLLLKEESIHTAIKRADTALYQSKSNGRNMITQL